MEPIVEAIGLSKAFGGVPVLQGVSFKLFPGDLVALAGENGAGKSTIFKILTGQVKPDGGEIRINGQPVAKLDTVAARLAGVAIVPQELATFPDMTVYENLYQGREIKGKLGFLDRPAMIRGANEMLAQFGISEIDPKRPMRTLSTALAQIVEILKATTWNAKAVLLDEPTSSIAEQEVEALYRVIRELKKQGVAMMYTTHRMAEIQDLADRVVVMRDGNLVLDDSIKNASEQTIIQSMIGRALEKLFPEKNPIQSEVALRVDGLQLHKESKPVSFELHRGEILGLGGLVGAGRTEIAEAIFGIRLKHAGEIEVLGHKLPKNSSAGLAIKSGLALVPEDRKISGLVLQRSVLDNASLPHLESFSKVGFVQEGSRRKKVSEVVKKLLLKARSIDQSVGSLSGGNQQKVVISKWLTKEAKVLILDEPTRGVDVGARGEIYQIIHELANQGMAVLLISSDMPELIGLSHRVLVIRDEHIAGSLSEKELSKPDAQEKIFRFASGLEVAA